jgi:hypothetical protein
MNNKYKAPRIGLDVHTYTKSFDVEIQTFFLKAKFIYTTALYLPPCELLLDPQKEPKN